MGASRSVCQKTGAISPVSCIIKETGVLLWRNGKKTRGAKIGYSEPPFAIMKIAQATVCDYFQNGCTTNDRLSRNIKTV